MVLGMIAKKVATQEGHKVVAPLRPCVVRHRVVVRFTMRQIRTNEKQLEARRKCRYHPVQHNVTLRHLGAIDQNVKQCPIPE